MIYLDFLFVYGSTHDTQKEEEEEEGENIKYMD